MKKPTLVDIDGVFVALSHEARRHVLVLLAQRGGELSSGYLAARFEHSWPTTTRHLKVLEDAGLVEVRYEGRNSQYRLCRERLRAIVGAWLAYLEPADARRTWHATGPRTTQGLRHRSESEGSTHEHQPFDRQDLSGDAGGRRPRKGGRVLRKPLGQPG